MNSYKLLIAALLFSFLFVGDAIATEENRTDLQTSISDNKLIHYNAHKTFDTLTNINDSALNVLTDGFDAFNVCGEADTVNNNTVYYGASTTLTANTFNGQACDINAVGNVTEATVDELIYTSQAVDVTGMTCRNEADANADISFTLRTAAGATVPSVTCTISDGERDCVADIQTTTAIAAGATVAIAAASTSSVAAGNGFVCVVGVRY